MGYIGTLSVVWENGERNVFQIAQNKNGIYIGEHMVTPRNEKSMVGVLREISEIMGNPPPKVKQYNWLELKQALRFPEVKNS